MFTTAGAWELVGEDDQYRLLSRCFDTTAVVGQPNLTRRLLCRAFELYDAGALTETQHRLVVQRIDDIEGNWLVSADAPSTSCSREPLGT